jgi:hypothetical protein
MYRVCTIDCTIKLGRFNARGVTDVRSTYAEVHVLKKALVVRSSTSCAKFYVNFVFCKGNSSQLNTNHTDLHPTQRREGWDRISIFESYLGHCNR